MSAWRRLAAGTHDDHLREMTGHAPVHGEPMMWRRPADGTDVPLLPDEPGYETFKSCFEDPYEAFVERWDGPAFVGVDHWPPLRGGVRYEMPEWTGDRTLAGEGYVRLETGQLDLGLIYDLPPWWRPIARWRKRRLVRTTLTGWIEGDG